MVPVLLTHQGSNLNSSEPKSDVLPITPWVNSSVKGAAKLGKYFDQQELCELYLTLNIAFFCNLLLLTNNFKFIIRSILLYADRGKHC
jgi:hypothetical protein